jgi:predicted  nucleic acid-binding Zn-ribbon protein
MKPERERNLREQARKDVIVVGVGKRLGDIFLELFSEIDRLRTLLNNYQYEQDGFKAEIYGLRAQNKKLKKDYEDLEKKFRDELEDSGIL